ncbi:MAG: hypothetical protein OEM02_01660 [Desulfobulbaceae bacterium]|nr:hypothetical protein [Desulfobulbaceae bacterium]
MISDLDNYINYLFEIYDDLRSSELQEKKDDATKEKVAKGLKESCLILQDILGSNLLDQIQLTLKDVEVIRLLIEKGTFENFINNFERNFLELTKINPLIINELLKEILVSIKSTETPNPKWKENFRLFTNTVCVESQEVTNTAKHIPLLRRVLLATGGVLIAYINLVKLPDVTIPSPVKGVSMAVGIWCISLATEDIFDKLLRQKIKTGKYTYH